MDLSDHLTLRQRRPFDNPFAWALLAASLACGCPRENGTDSGPSAETEPARARAPIEQAEPQSVAPDEEHASAAGPHRPSLPPWDEAVFENMVLVPAGPVWLGRERLAFQRDLGEFLIDRTEVTVADFARCVEALGCAPPVLERCHPEELRNWQHPERQRHPINCVRWDQAVAYCSWRGLRLPTPAEWEKAARGEDARAYPWGDEPASCELAVMAESDDAPGCGAGTTAEVGSRPAGASPYGALDMAGNVSEWTGDPARMREWVGLLKASGGGFLDGAAELRSDEVLADTIGRRDRIRVDLGFRCAYSTVPTYLPEPARGAEE
jgi:formylglycine-generating enzyme required for sulfatase activity